MSPQALPLVLVFLAFLSLSLVSPASAVITGPPIVDTPYGRYQAHVVGQQHQFLAIPYAQPPIGNRRFAAPKPLVPPSERGVTRAPESTRDGARTDGEHRGPAVEVEEQHAFTTISAPLSTLMPSGTVILREDTAVPTEDVVSMATAAAGVATVDLNVSNLEVHFSESSTTNTPLATQNELEHPTVLALLKEAVYTIADPTPSHAGFEKKLEFQPPQAGGLIEYAKKEKNVSSIEKAGRGAIETPHAEIVNMKVLEALEISEDEEAGLVFRQLSSDKQTRTAAKPSQTYTHRHQRRSVSSGTTMRKGESIYVPADELDFNPETDEFFLELRVPPPGGKLDASHIALTGLDFENIRALQRNTAAVDSPPKVHYASKFGPICPQRPGRGYHLDGVKWPENEDCLTLNIFRPARDEYNFKPGHNSSAQLLPVVVFIHGGAFESGGAPYYSMEGFTNLAAKKKTPVLAIVLQYRLSLLGFLQTIDLDEGDMNAGLRDQRLALKWIKDNVVYFGGDPDKITLMGHSAGALSVGTHLLWDQADPSYYSSELFHQAVCLSGGPIWYSSAPQPQKYEATYQALLSTIGCTDVACLRRLPLQKLQLFLASNPIRTLPFIGKPIYRDFPSRLIKSGNFLHIPIVFGSTSDEAASSTPQGLNTEKEFQDFIINNNNTAQTANFVEVIQKLYPPGQTHEFFDYLPASYNATAEDGEQYKRLVTYRTDRSWVMPRRMAADAWLKKSTAKEKGVWSYRFDALPIYTTTPEKYGVHHDVDTRFALYMTKDMRYWEEKIASEMAERLAGFATYSVPNVIGRKPWPRYGYSPEDRRISRLQMVFTLHHSKVEKDNFRDLETQFLERFTDELRI